MHVREYPSGAVILKEGDKINCDYMLWILDGETTFEAAAHVSAPSWCPCWAQERRWAK